MKKHLYLVLIITLMLGFCASCTPVQQKQTLKILNWGQYIDPAVITSFENEHDIHIIYDTFDSNESMYNKVATGAVTYDLLFPSDYMAEKMIADNMLSPLDYAQIPNMSYINPELLHRDFDPEQQYTLPFFWGTVGIMYDKTKVSEDVISWDILWNETYRDDIFMYNSARDSLMVALKKLGFSMNTHNIDEVNAAKNELLRQKPLILGYVGDEVINAMINNQAALAVVYSGDATSIMDENPNMAYGIPQEGTNMWVDTVVIPTNAPEKTLAHTFINYLNRPDIAKLNTEAVGYSTPNMETLTLLRREDSPWINWQSYNPTLTRYQHLEFFHVDNETLVLYNTAWEEVLNA